MTQGMLTALSRIALAILVVVFVAGLVSARTIGEIIDDTRIAGEVKARLTAESLSNFVKIDVTAESGIVTLNGIVDTPEKRARAAQIAGAVGGVKGLVNNIQVSGATPSGPPTGGLPGEIIGTVASVDPVASTVTLTDGRVLKVTGTVWQPTTLRDLEPGRLVRIDGATAAEAPAPSASPR
jgi:BON domain-containing protein